MDIADARCNHEVYNTSFFIQGFLKMCKLHCCLLKQTTNYSLSSLPLWPPRFYFSARKASLPLGATLGLCTGCSNVLFKDYKPRKLIFQPHLYIGAVHA